MSDAKKVHFFSIQQHKLLLFLKIQTNTCTSCSKYFNTSSLDRCSSLWTASLLTITSGKSMVSSSRATVRSSSSGLKFPSSQWTSSTALWFIQSTVRRYWGKFTEYWMFSSRNLLRQSLLVLTCADGCLRNTSSANGPWVGFMGREKESVLDEVELGLSELSDGLKLLGSTTGKL